MLKDPNELYHHALNALHNAYAPYSRHPVGAAILAESGKIYGGCNVETANYKGTCAEAGAIAAMINAGDRHIKTLAVVGPSDHLCSPCGDCRQRIREFAHLQDTKIHVFNNQGVLLKSYTVEDLLPDSFGPENLPR